jgi:hypothetical protein
MGAEFKRKQAMQRAALQRQTEEEQQPDSARQGSDLASHMLLMQRTMGNQTTVQLLRANIQREGDSEEEDKQESRLDMWTRKLQQHEQMAIDLKAALKDGEYDVANSIFQKLLNISSIIKAKTGIKEGFSTNLKVLGSVITGRGQHTRMDRLRVLDISNRYNKLAMEIDRLAKKYYQIPQVYDAIAAYMHARSTSETLVEQNI